MQRKMLTFLLAAAVATGTGFAHGGKSHRLLGTLEELQTSALVVETPDGRKATVQLDQATRYEKERKPAARSDLSPGVRVAIHLTEDDKTAVLVKIGTAPPAKPAG